MVKMSESEIPPFRYTAETAGEIEPRWQAYWEERGTFIARIARVTFYHFDLYAQALAKVERAHQQDLDDVRAMLDRKLIDPRRALEYFERIEPDLYRFPAIDAPSFRRAVEAAFAA